MHTSATSERIGVRRRATAQLAVGVFAFFITANMKVHENGMGKITLVYPAAPITTSDIERRRYDSETTKTASVRLDGGLARIRILFSDVRRLAEAPEFRNGLFAIEPEADGTARLRVELRATVLGNVISDRPARVRITVPGPIVQSNAQQIDGTSARWSLPVTRYFTSEGLQLDATYRGPVPPRTPEQQARNTPSGQ